DLSYMSYTGFTLAELRAQAEPAQLQLLSRLDLLVDGRYLRDQHTTLMWRGSQNQQVHFLSDRHANLRNSVNQTTVSLDLTIEEDGSIRGAGIFPKGFEAALDQGMNQRGIVFGERGGKKHEQHPQASKS